MPVGTMPQLMAVPLAFFSAATAAAAIVGGAAGAAAAAKAMGVRPEECSVYSLSSIKGVIRA